VEHLNGIDNVMNLQRDAHAKFNEIQWAIQANEDHGQVNIGYTGLVLWNLTSFRLHTPSGSFYVAIILAQAISV
jgi:hypothetical protein